MPEAAEVAVAARQLASVAVGRRVESLDVTHPRTVRSVPGGGGALDRFVGRVVRAVDRHGKWILVSVDGEPDRLGIHLRMSGQLAAAAPGAPHPDRHVHAVIELGRRGAEAAPLAPAGPGHPAGIAAFDVPAAPLGAPGTGAGRTEVRFRDPRTFGELRILPAGAPVAADLFDPATTGESLYLRSLRRRVGVKAVLLDQARVVAGIGSYLADEALHRAGIDPRTPADTLAPDTWARVLSESRSLVREMAAVGGVTLADEGWVDLWGRTGAGADLLRVHARTTCAACGAETARADVGGRSARWCPACQPPPRHLALDRSR